MNLLDRQGFLAYTGGFLLVMLLITIALAAMAGIAPFHAIHLNLTDFVIGVVAALVMVIVFSVFSSVRNEAENLLGPSLAACRWYDFVVLAALVGLIEELLFRGVLEPWMARSFSPVVALIGVNLFFGFLHYVSIAYAVIAAVLGCLLSLLAYGPGESNLLRPIVAHAVYDFIGFMWIAHTYRRKNPDAALTPESQSEESHVD